jgi:hypothetical protein
MRCWSRAGQHHGRPAVEGLGDSGGLVLQVAGSGPRQGPEMAVATT